MGDCFDVTTDRKLQKLQHGTVVGSTQREAFKALSLLSSVRSVAAAEVEKTHHHFDLFHSPLTTVYFLPDGIER